MSETKPLPVRPFLALSATVAQVSVLIFGSLLPQKFKHAIGTQGIWHRPLHLVLFATTAFTAKSAFGRYPLVTPVLLIALALSLEFAEHVFYFNLFEWNDVRDDVIGIAIGLLLARVSGW